MTKNMLRKNDLAKKILAGVFFIGGIWLTSMVIFTIGKGKGFTQPKFQVTVLYKNVGGLIEGAPVRLLGVNVGYVDSINFLARENEVPLVVVVLNIFSKYKKQLNSTAVFAIKTEGILGEKLIEITLLGNGSKFDLSHPTIGLDPLDVQDMAEVFSNAAESFTQTSESLRSIDVQKLSDALSEAAWSLSTTSKGINSILHELRYLTRKSKRLMNRFEEKLIDGDLFKVF